MIPIQPGNFRSVKRWGENGHDVLPVDKIVVPLMIWIRNSQRPAKPIFIENQCFLDGVVFVPALRASGMLFAMVVIVGYEVMAVRTPFGFVTRLVSAAIWNIGSFFHRMFVFAGVRTIFRK